MEREFMSAINETITKHEIELGNLRQLREKLLRQLNDVDNSIERREGVVNRLRGVQARREPDVLGAGLIG